MPVLMRYREDPCKRCKGPGGWKQLKIQKLHVWKPVEEMPLKATFETEWVPCPWCWGKGRIYMTGPPDGVVETLAMRCTISYGTEVKEDL